MTQLRLRGPIYYLGQDGVMRAYGRPPLTPPAAQPNRMRVLGARGSWEPVVVPVDNFVLGTTKPNAANTGVDPAVVLAPITGPITYGAPGVLIEGKRFTNWVSVRAANITFRNCLFNGNPNGNFTTTSYGLADCRDGSAQNALFDRCTFAATATNMYWNNGVSIRAGASVTVNRCDISRVADGLNVSGGQLTATGNYVHGLYFFNNSGDHSSDAQHPYWEHNDGVQIQGGSGPFVIRGNYFESYQVLGTDDGVHGLPRTDPATGSWDRRYGAGVTASPDQGQITGATITENWFEGGTASFQSSSSAQVGANFGTIGSNRFGRDQYNYNLAGNDRYQIRYKNGIVIAGLTSNYFDPDAPSVPPDQRGQLFAVGTTTGIRLD